VSWLVEIRLARAALRMVCSVFGRLAA